MAIMKSLQELKKDPAVKNEIQKRVDDIFEKAIKDPDIIELHTVIGNNVFHGIVLEELISRVQKLEKEMDGNRFTKGIDL